MNTSSTGTTSTEVTITSIEREGLMAKAPRDSSFIRRFEAEYQGRHYVAWYDTEGWIAAHLSPVPVDQRGLLVEALYIADLKQRIRTGEIQPGRSNVYFASDGTDLLPGEIVVADALVQVRALPGAR